MCAMYDRSNRGQKTVSIQCDRHPSTASAEIAPGATFAPETGLYGPCRSRILANDAADADVAWAALRLRQQVDSGVEAMQAVLARLEASPVAFRGPDGAGDRRSWEIGGQFQLASPGNSASAFFDRIRSRSAGCPSVHSRIFASVAPT